MGSFLLVTHPMSLYLSKYYFWNKVLLYTGLKSERDLFGIATYGCMYLNAVLLFIDILAFINDITVSVYNQLTVRSDLCGVIKAENS